ncbi:LLM class flavin-dependent oxidoreductase [Jiangella endophytica]|uniref:LLM class flavin-dependent oxidoreductase n=1 Tax=Jiangella endophytica TaxID=1623398 RepID=UPI000E34230D|nr:LLM class flavin-dependent oxidoreductase [Jiangella endophytica]
MGDHQHPATAVHLGVGLSGQQLVALAADAELRSHVDDAAPAFVVAGVDRIDGSIPDDQTLEPTVAATFLARRAPHTAVLAAAAPHRDHPYNLARRVASADHLSRGRSGLVLGIRDGYAPRGPAGHEAWGGAGLTAGAPLGVDTTRDAAIAIEKLWQSWPYESIVADRRTRIFVRAEQIVHIDHQGVFDIAGPLTVPSTPQGSPVLAWYARTADEVEAAREVADLVILSATEPGATATAAAALSSGDSGRFADPSRRPLLFAELPHHAGDEPGVLESAVRSVSGDVDGVLVRPGRTADDLVRFVEAGLPALLAGGLVRTAPAATLRERLALPVPARLLDGARPAFPAPEPQPALRP